MLENEKDLICVYLAETGYQKYRAMGDPRYVPAYACKVAEQGLVMERVSMGLFVNTIKKFTGDAKTLAFADIREVKKSPRILAFTYNFGFPRFKVFLKDGTTRMLVIPHSQKILAGKTRYVEGRREALVDRLLSLKA